MKRKVSLFICFCFYLQWTVGIEPRNLSCQLALLSPAIRKHRRSTRESCMLYTRTRSAEFISFCKSIWECSFFSTWQLPILLPIAWISVYVEGCVFFIGFLYNYLHSTGLSLFYVNIRGKGGKYNWFANQFKSQHWLISSYLPPRPIVKKKLLKCIPARQNATRQNRMGYIVPFYDTRYGQ